MHYFVTEQNLYGVWALETTSAWCFSKPALLKCSSRVTSIMLPYSFVSPSSMSISTSKSDRPICGHTITRYIRFTRAINCPMRNRLTTSICGYDCVGGIGTGPNLVDKQCLRNNQIMFRAKWCTPTCMHV